MSRIGHPRTFGCMRRAVLDYVVREYAGGGTKPVEIATVLEAWELPDGRIVHWPRGAPVLLERLDQKNDAGLWSYRKPTVVTK